MADYNVVKFSGNSNVGLSYPSYFLDFVSGYLTGAVPIVLLSSTLKLKKKVSVYGAAFYHLQNWHKFRSVLGCWAVLILSSLMNLINLKLSSVFAQFWRLSVWKNIEIIYFLNSAMFQLT